MPHLDPIEKFWANLRDKGTHNMYYDSVEGSQVEVVEFLRQFKAPN